MEELNEFQKKFFEQLKNNPFIELHDTVLQYIRHE